MDQMARRYSVKRKTRHWTMSLFFTQIDIAGINAYAIHKELYPHSKICNDRMTFLILMGQNLCKTMVMTRPLFGLQKSTLCAIKTVSGRTYPEEQNTALKDVSTRPRCSLCVNAVGALNAARPRSTACAICQKAVCSQHLVTVCKRCVDSEE